MIVKENQPGLLALLQVYFETSLATHIPLQRASRQEVGHGRIERRTLTSTTALAGKLSWPGLAQGFRLERWAKEKKTGKERHEVVYGITSLPRRQASAGALLAGTRGHWRIENRTHWVRDVTFDEDRSQARCGSIPQVLAGVRNLAIGLLRLAGQQNIAAGTRYYAARPWEALALLGIPSTTK
jgi:predicted transposase YbfD/YdcC